METKTCTKCGEGKPLDQFYFRSAGKLYYWCKKCRSEANHRWRADNLEKANASSAKWRANNPEKEKTRAANRYANNPEKERARKAKWRADNPEKVRARKAKQVAELSPIYVAKILNISVSQLTPELLEAKREHLRNIRITKQLIATLKEIQNGK